MKPALVVMLMWLGIIGALVALVFLVLLVGPTATLLVVLIGGGLTAWSLQLARAGLSPRGHDPSPD